MRLSLEESEDCLIVSVNETRIDAAAAVQFKEAMRDVIDQAPARIILDLSPVDSIDSSGLGAIVAVMKMLGANRSLELMNLSNKVGTVFRLTRMDAVMTIHSDRKAAVGTHETTPT